MDFDDIDQLVERMRAHGLAELELENENEEANDGEGEAENRERGAPGRPGGRGDPPILQ